MKITKTLLIISILLFKNITCFAQWSTDATINNSISTTQNNQSFPKIVSDGSGGAIIVWEDDRNGASNSNIYAQRIDSNGLIQWATDGIAICTSANDQKYVEIISDGNGGAIIAWNDYRNSTSDYDIYAQKINSSGIVQWSNNGVAICTATNSNYNPQMITDGNGGAIITWMDNRIDTNNGDIYAQSINSSGVVQWIADGVVICGNTAQNDFPEIVTDGKGGAIITWMDTRGSFFDIYAQQINSSGVVQWTNNGIIICNAANSQSYPSIVSDNNGGAIVSWTDSRNSINSPDIYAQLVNSNGIIQWSYNGVAICTSFGDQNSPVMVSDGSGGAIIAWTDYRTTANSADVYAQRINSTGIVQWATNGVAISKEAYNQWLPNIISDGNGGAIITWEDKRLVSYSDIYTQHINFNGIVQWTTNGIPISTATNIQRNPVIVSDGNGGAIITWGDYRTGTSYDIYAQRINITGNLSTEMQTVLNNSFFNVFPNPSNGLITFQSIENISNIYIINQLGESVYKETSVNHNKKELDLTNLSNGIYIYKIISEGNKISNGKLIIIH